MTRSSFRLTAKQAALRPEGHLVMNGPVHDLHAGPLITPDGKKDARARTKQEAVEAMLAAGLPYSDARLETHSFSDPITNDVRRVSVWVPAPPI